MLGKKITELEYNYLPPVMEGSADVRLDLYPEEVTTATLGKGGVVEIEEHCAMGEGDKWYYDIKMETGKVIRTFKPHLVVFEPIKQG